MKKFRKYLSISALALAAMIVVSSCNKDDDAAAPVDQDNTELKSIVATASSNEDFSILVDAVVKANLVDVLEGDGPFTVFAPTNAAFEELFSTLDVSGIDALPAIAIQEILLNHVVSAEVKSMDLLTGYVETINTFNPGIMGSSLLVDVNNGVMINGTTKVVTADLKATNGIIHAVDKVILPKSIVEFAIDNPNFSILVEAVVKAGLVDALSAGNPFTVFAPTNAAFEDLFAELQVSGIADLSAEVLTPILLYHVVGANVNSSQLATGKVPTLNNQAELQIDADSRGVIINGKSSVVLVDVQTKNGVIHAIDKVLLP